MTWPMPTFGLQTAEVLEYPDWAATGDTLAIDIQPTGGSNSIRPGRTPMEPDVPWSYVGYCEDPSPITVHNPTNYRLSWNGIVLAVLRLRDWDGFFTLDLDNVEE